MGDLMGTRALRWAFVTGAGGQRVGGYEVWFGTVRSANGGQGGRLEAWPGSGQLVGCRWVTIRAVGTPSGGVTCEGGTSRRFPDPEGIATEREHDAGPAAFGVGQQALPRP